MNSSHDLLLIEKLEQLRTKLLDLSLANRLLNFKHSPQGRSFLRIIDDTPCALWERLQAQSLIFHFLPDLEEESTQACSSSFTQALGLSSRLSLTSNLIKQAKKQGIDPSFDLPSEHPFPHAHLQLLLLPKAAEQQLSYVRDTAYQRLEETGINMLFCAFGFLQWYETTESITPLYAPLILLPVKLKREIRQHQWIYTLSSTDEDPLLNLTLKEKLRQLGLILPEWEENETPETYWKRLEPLIQSQKRWKICRWATVGIFPFSRMAMYEDLDPHHPQLLNHLQIRELLLGHEIASSSDKSQKSEDQQTLFTPPLLMSKVDSSQYAAICQALQCPNLVIKGPPGTGKSQTITNLIAASLAQGENVLFVADKQAALNVVFSRLQEMGLADFCLELHSHQATRTSVVHSLKKRLEISVTEKSKNLEIKLAETQKHHHVLDLYAHLMQRPLGQTQFPIQKILWAARRASDSTHFPASLFKIYFEKADEITPEDIQNAKSLLQRVEKNYPLAMEGIEQFHHHPWKGVAHTALSPFQIEELGELFQALYFLIQRIQQECQHFETQYHVQLHTLQETEQFTSQLLSSLALTENIETETLTHFEKEDGESKIQQLIQTIEELQIAFPTISHLDQEIEHCQLQIQGLERIQRLSTELAQAFDLEGQLTIGALNDIWIAVNVVARTPFSILKWRYPFLYQENADSILFQAQQQAQKLRQQRQELEKRFKLEKWQHTHDLTLLNQKSFWNLFRPSFYRMQQFYREICLYPQHSLQHMVTDLQELQTHFAACLKFEQDPLIHQLCGPHFIGIQTDFISLLEIAQFGIEIKKRFAHPNPTHQAICTLLLEGKTEKLQELVAYTKHSMAFALNHFLASSSDSFTLPFDSCIETWKNHQKKLLSLKQFSSCPFSLPQIQKTLFYCQHVRKQPLLAPLANQLLSPKVKRVQEEWKAFAYSLSQQLLSLKTYWETLQSMGGIEEK